MYPNILSFPDIDIANNLQIPGTLIGRPSSHKVLVHNALELEKDYDDFEEMVFEQYQASLDHPTSLHLGLISCD